jgi:hypothetical protein
MRHRWITWIHIDLSKNDPDLKGNLVPFPRGARIGRVTIPAFILRSN